MTRTPLSTPFFPEEARRGRNAASDAAQTVKPRRNLPEPPALLDLAPQRLLCSTLGSSPTPTVEVRGNNMLTTRAQLAATAHLTHQSIKANDIIH